MRNSTPLARARGAPPWPELGVHTPNKSIPGFLHNLQINLVMLSDSINIINPLSASALPLTTKIV
jgi:hypothetical protein